MTIKKAFMQTCRDYPDQTAIRFKQDGAWKSLRWRELLDRTRQVSEITARLKIRRGERVAIHMENERRWPEVYLGIVSAGLTAVPIDAKLRPAEIAHILRDSGAAAVFVSARTYPMLREAVETVSSLQNVILLDGSGLMPILNGHIHYLDYEQTMAEVAEAAAGEKCCFRMHDPQPESTASIIYTSGTTGRQKGAMLTHANFCANVASIRRAITMRPDDSFLIVLPLHHAFAFTANLLLPVFTGLEMSFVESLKTVGENIREVRPTVLVGVPLLIEKLYARIMAGLRAKPLAWTLFRLGLRGPIVRGIREKLGGRLRLAVVGGAPCAPAVLHGFAALGLTALEGYGLTETAPVLTLNPETAPRPGTVGKPLPDVSISILDPNPEGIGEIAAQGPNIMPGYFKNEAATREVFRDGWFLTGDMGFVDADGYITITGRKKSLIVNREGKNIYPEEVESAILESPFVLESLVLAYRGDGETGERVGAIVVPDPEAIDRLKHKALSDEALTALIVKKAREAASELAEYKRPRLVQVRYEEFEKTSTGKIKRYLYAITPSEV